MISIVWGNNCVGCASKVDWYDEPLFWLFRLIQLTHQVTKSHELASA